MAGIVHSIEELVGHTPLMELDRFERQQQCGAHLLAKLEFFNPTGSVKDRAALSMIQAAEASGVSPSRCSRSRKAAYSLRKRSKSGLEGRNLSEKYPSSQGIAAANTQ